MTRRNVTDEQYGRLCRRAGELLRRVDEGALDFFQVMASLQAAIEGRWSNQRNFSVWKTIQLGTGIKDADEFRLSLKNGRFKISNWANDIMGKPAFTVASEKSELDLVIVSAAELGFPDCATRKEIYESAYSLGLDRCPPEAGPQLRRQYLYQPSGEWLLMAMEPIKDSDGDLRVFIIEHTGAGLWLRANHGRPGHVWNPVNRWVFALRK